LLLQVEERHFQQLQELLVAEPGGGKPEVVPHHEVQPRGDLDPRPDALAERAAVRWRHPLRSCRRTGGRRSWRGARDRRSAWGTRDRRPWWDARGGRGRWHRPLSVESGALADPLEELGPVILRT